MARRQDVSPSNKNSAIIGGALLVLAIFALILLIMSHNSGSSAFAIPGFGSAQTPDASSQIPVLLSEGITLGQASQTPVFNQQQALLIANQLVPDAAAQAKSASASYVLLNYPNTATPATHANLSNVSAWMVWYQHIPYQPADAAVDPTPFPHAYHDLYVFIDATSGKELLAVWA